MSKKKRFGISEALTRGLSETINVVENNAGIYRNAVVPISRLEIDPDNPRKLNIDMIDVKHSIKTDDPQYQQKQTELDRIKELAHTISANGLINPIVVYKRGELYRIVAGERRYLASLVLGKQEIEARVFNEKPSAYELKMIQWVENTAREDLTLFERLENMREIVHEYQKLHLDETMTATLLKTLTGLSLSQTTYYMAVLNAPSEVTEQIQLGNISNLDKAALIANVADKQLRGQALAACVNGASVKDLRALINSLKTNSTVPTLTKVSSHERDINKINLGSTRHIEVVKMLMQGALQQSNLHSFRDRFMQINWHDKQQVNRAFRKFIELLETEVADK